MNGKSDRTFRPQLESVEERELLSTFGSVFPGVRQLASLTSLAESFRFAVPQPNLNVSTHTPMAKGGSASSLTTFNSPATSVHLLVSPNTSSTFNYSLVPQQMGFGLTNLPSPVTLTTSTDFGLTTPGLITTSTLASDPGIYIPV